MSTKKKVEKPKTPMEELLGETLATNVKGAKTPTTTAFKDKDLVALYFSAKWDDCAILIKVLAMKPHFCCVSRKGGAHPVVLSALSWKNSTRHVPKRGNWRLFTSRRIRGVWYLFTLSSSSDMTHSHVWFFILAFRNGRNITVPCLGCPCQKEAEDQFLK